MAPKKEMAPIGLDPIDAGTALVIESKTELKFTNFFRIKSIFLGTIILFCNTNAGILLVYVETSNIGML